MKHSRNNIEVTENGRIVIGNSATKTVNRLRREIEKNKRTSTSEQTWLHSSCY